MFRSIILIFALFFTLAHSARPIPSPYATRISVSSGCDSIRCLYGQCVETPQGPRCIPSGHDQCACHGVYKPVCCRMRDGSVKTVSNACQCNGCGNLNSIVSEGRCPAQNTCVCSKIFDPVCCRTRKGLITKSNTCQCNCIRGASIAHKGSCSFDQ